MRIGWICSAGRNSGGRITVHHRGGGTKKNYFQIDWLRRLNCFGYLMRTVKIHHFSSFVGLILYENGFSNYILLSTITDMSERIYSGSRADKVPLYLGTALPLVHLKLFMIVCNIEIYPFSGASLARAAGTGAISTRQSMETSALKLRSGWNVKISNNCIATIGSASNAAHRFARISNKAGFIRALGIRPTVRGVAMNPCDHPHGGGEGKKSPPAAAKTPWARLTKGGPTVTKVNINKRWK